MSNALIYSTNGGQPSDNDTRLFHRAIKQRWPMSDETKARWLAKLDYNIEHGDIRESNSALKVAAAMDAANQRDELADKYAVSGEGHTGTIPSPAEIIAQMIATLPLVAVGPEAIDAPKGANAELAKYTNGPEGQKGAVLDNTA